MRHEVIHETIVRDIVDVIDAVKNNDAIHGVKGNSNSYRSIAQASSALTLVFPVITSRNVNIETASLISRTIETKAVVMLRMLFSAISIDDAKDGLDYIKKFHTNLNKSMSVDDYLDAMERVLESSNVRVNREQYDAIARDLRNLGNVLAESCSENSLNNYKVHPQVYGESTVVLEKFVPPENFKATPKRPHVNGGVPVNPITYDDDLDDAKHVISLGRAFGDGGLSGGRRDSGLNVKKTISTISSPKPVEKIIDGKGEEIKAKEKTVTDNSGYRERNSLILRRGGNGRAVELLDSDIKKANDLMPTQMSLNFISTSTGTPIETNLVIGIKATIHGVSSSDMINRLVVKNEDNNGLLKLVKATTREISFCRDFLFAIDKAKVDALSQSRRGSSSKLWKVLERRAVKSKLLRSLRQNNSAAAISTLLFTQEEAELIKKAHNIDLNNPRVLRPIMESYNLMGVCMVDQTIEQASFMFDTGEDLFEDYSFSSLERDNKKSDRNILNLLTKVAR